MRDVRQTSIGRATIRTAFLGAAAVAISPSPAGAAPPFSSAELDAITEHVYRGSSVAKSCGTECQLLWSKEQASNNNLLHRQLLTLRQRSKAVQSLKNLVGSFNAVGDVVLRLRGASEKRLTLTMPQGAGIFKGVGEGAFTSYITLPSDGLLWHWLQPGSGLQHWRLVPDLGQPYCNDHPEVPVGANLQLLGGTQSIWCAAGRLWQAGFIPNDEVVVKGPIGDAQESDTYDAYLNTGDQNWHGVRTKVEAAIDDADLDYLARWYRFHLSGGDACDPDGPSCERQLAERFRPLLLFDSDERWRPLDIDQFLDEQFTYEGPNGSVTVRHQICGGDPADPEDCRDITGAGSLQGGSGSWIDIWDGLLHMDQDYPMQGCGNEEELADCDSSRTAIYYRVPPASDSGGYRLFDYWWFFRRDAGYAGSSSHEGDWEGMTVAVPEADDDEWPDTFDWAAFDSHGRTWRYLREVLRCEGQGNGSCGDQDSAQGKRVSTYVANGKHASYPRDCDSDEPLNPQICDQTTSDGSTNVPPEAGYDGQLAWSRNFDAPALKELPLGTSWMAFGGRWGATTPRGIVEGIPGAGSLEATSPRGPSTPNAHERWTNPAIPDCTERWGSQDSCGSSRRSDVGGASSQSGCELWFGAHVAMGACHAASLADGLSSGTLQRDRTTFDVSSPGTDRVIGNAVGISQLIGSPLRPGESVTLRLNSGAPPDLVHVKYVTARSVRATNFDNLPSPDDPVIEILFPHGASTPELRMGETGVASLDRSWVLQSLTS